MSGYYPYLVATLPDLSFGMKPPSTFERFLWRAADFVPARDLALLESLPSIATSATCARAPNPTLRAWLDFETMVRNELVAVRAARKHVEPAQYLRCGRAPESSYAAHIAINAYRKTSPLETERALDVDRWHKLDELEFGHYFDIDVLIVYGIRLLILEKWDRISGADGASLLEETLSAGRKAEVKESS